jgi:serine/threonine protein phosphatase PrpC
MEVVRMVGFIKKLFGTRKISTPVIDDTVIGEAIKPNVNAAPPTLPLKDPTDALAQIVQDDHSDDGKYLVAGFGQSIGKQRDHNEDSLFVLTTELSGENLQIPFGLYIVADGMGGHQHGDIASGTAVRAMAGYILRELYLPLIDLPQNTPSMPLQEIMQNGLYEAHKIIPKFAPGGGTTMTAVLIMGDQLTIAHVGDSRAYAVYGDGHMQVLTRDHSLVKRLEELGQLTAEEAAQHPQRNVLYRALGQAEPFEPDITTFPIHHPGYLFLCSDGLWGVVSEREIFQMIASSASPQQACTKLVDAANAAGGPDNITAILVRMPN